jgi:hypothetical protein
MKKVLVLPALVFAVTVGTVTVTSTAWGAEAMRESRPSSAPIYRSPSLPPPVPPSSWPSPSGPTIGRASDLPPCVYCENGPYPYDVVLDEYGNPILPYGNEIFDPYGNPVGDLQTYPEMNLNTDPVPPWWAIPSGD